MAPKKTTKPEAKETQEPVKTPVKTENPIRLPLTAINGGRPKLGSLAQLAAQLQEKHRNPEAVPAERDGFGKPVPRTVTEMRIMLSDGTVLLAEGKHADVLFRYNEECQQQCQDNGLAIYNGPPLSRFSREQWAARDTQK